jgi:hypothetical protein
MRSAIRITGAAKPIWSDVGSKPTMKVDDPMIVMVIRKVYLRPTRSPMPAEHQRAERAHQEPRRERQQSEDVARGLGKLTEELGADDHGERTVQVEVIPLEDRPQARGENDTDQSRRSWQAQVKFKVIWSQLLKARITMVKSRPFLSSG